MALNIDTVAAPSVVSQTEESRKKDKAIKFTSLTEGIIRKRYDKKIKKNRDAAAKVREKIDKVNAAIIAEKSYDEVDEYELARLEKKLDILSGNLKVYMSREPYLEQMCDASIEKYCRPIKIAGHHVGVISRFFKNFFKSKKVDVDSIRPSDVQKIVEQKFADLDKKGTENSLEGNEKKKNESSSVSSDNSFDSSNENVNELENELGLNLHDEEDNDSTYSFSGDDLVQDAPILPPEPVVTQDSSIVEEKSQQVSVPEDFGQYKVSTHYDSNDGVKNENTAAVPSGNFSKVEPDSISAQYDEIFKNIVPQSTIDSIGVAGANQEKIKSDLLGSFDEFMRKSSDAPTFLDDLGLPDDDVIHQRGSEAVDKYSKLSSDEKDDLLHQHNLNAEVNRRFKEKYGNLDFDFTQDEVSELKKYIESNIIKEEMEEKARIAKAETEAKKAEEKAKAEAERASIFANEIMGLRKSDEEHDQEISRLQSETDTLVEELKSVRATISSMQEYSKKSFGDSSDLDKMLSDTGSDSYSDSGSKRR